MSGFHAKIEGKMQNNEVSFILRDAGSTNRTWLRLSGESEKSFLYKLKIEDFIKIGSTVMMIQKPDE